MRLPESLPSMSPAITTHVMYNLYSNVSYRLINKSDSEETPSEHEVFTLDKHFVLIYAAADIRLQNR